MTTVSAELTLAGTSAAIITTDPENVILGWNPAAQALFGWAEQEALGRTVDELLLAADWRPIGVFEAVSAGRPWSGKLTGRHKNGRPLRVVTTISPVQEGGRVVALVGHSREMLSDEVDEELVRRLSAIVESSADSIVGLETDGRIVSWNPASERIYGWSASEVVGRSVYGLLPDEQHEALRSLLARVAVGEVVAETQTRAYRKDGSSFAVDLRVSSILGDDGALTGFSGIARDVTGRVALERAAGADRARLAKAQAIAHVGSCEIDLATGVTRWSAEGWRILGLDPAGTITQEDFLGVVHPVDAPGLRAALAALCAGTVPPLQEFRVRRPGGEVRWVHESFALDARDPGSTALGTMHDVTATRTADAERRAAEAQLRRSFEGAAIGMITTDLEGHVLTVNPAFLDIVGRTHAEVVGTRSAQFTHPDDLVHLTPRPTMIDGGEPSFVAEHRMLRADTSVAWVQKTSTLVRDDDGAPAFFTVQLQDISARRAAEIELARRAAHDSLTGLPNRELLVDRLEQALARTIRGGEDVSVVFLDVDQFKDVNDELGHAAGDALLVQLARRLQAAVRPGDTLARFGGDEFVLVCEGVGRAEVDQLVARVEGAVSSPFQLDGRDVGVTVSAGIATGGAGVSAEGLMHDADSAMYRAKQAGRARTVVFDDAMVATASARLDVERALRTALEQDQLEVHYQPVVNTRTGVVAGLEALVRWRHPERGLLGPGAFLDLAEETGLLPAVGSWVLRRATGQLVRWRGQLRGAQELWVAVNLSGRELSEPGLVDTVASALADSGLPPGALHLELAEASAGGEGVAGVLDALHAIGVRMSVDDFGTGYSSLSSLQDLPIDTLKIDRSFVAGLASRAPDERSIVTTVTSVAAALGLAVVAEGVETLEQLDALRGLGVGTAQGHLWSAALTAEELAQWWFEHRESAPF